MFVYACLILYMVYMMIAGYRRKDPLCARPFEGLRIIDVGCGGGILSEVFMHVCHWNFLHIRNYLVVF